MAVVVSPELVKRIAGHIAEFQQVLTEAKCGIEETTRSMHQMATTFGNPERRAEAKDWAQRTRRLEALAMKWIYESETSSTADLARRTLAQTVGLRRLLDQLAGCVTRHGEESEP